MNLLDHWAEEAPVVEHHELQMVRLSANAVIVIPFTTSMVPVQLHYCEEPEIRGYVHCNGPGCVLCRIRRLVEERVLLPVYLPMDQSIAILPISPNSRPGALRPQILPVLRSNARLAMSIRKLDHAKFVVDTHELRDGLDDGAGTIAEFLVRWEAGRVDLTTIYPRLDDNLLAEVPGIARILPFMEGRPA